jgi:hypothetical protein
VSELSHIWQRFLLASSLLVGLAMGIAATVFGYSNLGSVDISWSVFHIDNIPLWTVAVVPVAVVLVAGTLYHWLDGLHHFTEHMRHRRRVHELEAELASLRAHLDQVLEMPDRTDLEEKRKVASLPAADEAMAELRPETPQDTVEPAKAEPAERAALEAPQPAPKPDVAAANGVGDDRVGRKGRASKGKRATLTTSPETAGADGKVEPVKAATQAAEETDTPVLGV